MVAAMVVIDRPAPYSTRLVSPQLTRTVNLARRTDVEPSAAASAMQQFVFDTVDRLTQLPARTSRAWSQPHRAKPVRAAELESGGSNRRCCKAVGAITLIWIHQRRYRPGPGTKSWH